MKQSSADQSLGLPALNNTISNLLPREFYDREPDLVAFDLIGKLLVRQLGKLRLVGRIVETEAYLKADDPASHSFRGPGKKNASMFGPPGTLYVYPIHAKYCMNCVTESEGVGSAVLLRAVEPIEGTSWMSEARGTERSLDLTRGPSRLCQAFSIDRSHDGISLTAGNLLWIESEPEQVPPKVLRSTRIGISSAQERLLRYFSADSRFVSGTQKLNRSGIES